MALVEVVGVRDQEIRRRTLAIINGKPFQVGRLTIQPDTVIATWSRDRIVSADFKSRQKWRMIALEAEGPRVIRGEVRTEAEHRVHHRFGLDAAPNWMTSIANRHIPEDDF